MKLFAIAKAFNMPDLAAFLKGEYMQNVTEYMGECETAADMLRSANFYGVAKPEFDPVKQLRKEVIPLVTKAGGSFSYLVANLIQQYGDDWSNQNQEREIVIMNEIATQLDADLLKVPRVPKVISRNLDERLESIKEISNHLRIES